MVVKKKLHYVWMDRGVKELECTNQLLEGLLGVANTQTTLSIVAYVKRVQYSFLFRTLFVTFARNCMLTSNQAIDTFSTPT